MNLNKSSFFICMALIAASLGSPVNDVQAVTAPTPPDYHDHIAMARFVVHQADWVSFSTISTMNDITGYPFGNVVAMADGALDISSGIPYFYLASIGLTSKDLMADNRCTVTTSLQQTGYCTEQDLIPDDPRCSRVMLSGSVIKMNNDTEEYEFAKNGLFSRHPAMAGYPEGHGFYIAKLDIEHIVTFDMIGGANYLDVDEYLKFEDAKVDKIFLN